MNAPASQQTLNAEPYAPRGAYLRAVFRHWALWREVMGNFHQVSPRLWRSGQPTPRQLNRRHRAIGLRSVVNLRGEPVGDAFIALEKAWCAQAGVAYHNLRMFSRKVPEADEVRAMRALMERIEYPALIHCKGGSDRTGLFATLYLHWMENQPLEKALRQMRFWPFLHFKSGKTGRLDYFFAAFLKYRQTHPDADLFTWATTVLDAGALQKRFQSKALSDFLLEVLLRRE
jgi:uncharacterized protein (TIGR01244 family)